MVSDGAVDIAVQVLANPSGQEAQLVAFTPEVGGPMELFKFNYASCLDKGDVDSVAGPRNRWVFGAVAGASEVVDGSLHLVEVKGASADATPARRDAEAALDAWANR